MIRQTYLQGFTLKDKESKAIELLRLYEPIALSRCDKGYIIGYSGGKDSDALVELFYRAGVKHHIIHNHTTMDAPETVYYIRRRFAEFQKRGETVEYILPEKNIWQLCKEKGILPTRICRFCCEELKEVKKEEYKYGAYSFGVRAEESARRKASRGEIEISNNKKKSQTFRFDNEYENKPFDVCYSKKYVAVNPLLYWNTDDIFESLESIGLTIDKINPLYYKGYNRIGCIGCPMGTPKQRRKEFEDYPKFKALWLKTCDEIVASGRTKFDTGKDYFEWWLSGLSTENYFKKIKGEKRNETNL
jgi:phosphoadenosine phosphosulfate reductase